MGPHPQACRPPTAMSGPEITWRKAEIGGLGGAEKLRALSANSVHSYRCVAGIGVPDYCDLAWNFFQGLFEATVHPILSGTVKPFSATAPSRPPWQDPRRRRQVVTGIGALLGCTSSSCSSPSSADRGSAPRSCRCPAAVPTRPARSPASTQSADAERPGHPARHHACSRDHPDRVADHIAHGNHPERRCHHRADPSRPAPRPGSGPPRATRRPRSSTSSCRPPHRSTTKAPPTRTTTAPPPTRSTSAPTSNPTAPPRPPPRPAPRQPPPKTQTPRKPRR